MSRRDLAHVMTALANAAQGELAPVPVAVLDEAIGRSAGDMRTPLNLQSLQAEGLVREGPSGMWSLTEAGRQRIRDDQELSDR
jgi:hypothetical protein